MHIEEYIDRIPIEVMDEIIAFTEKVKLDENLYPKLSIVHILRENEILGIIAYSLEPAGGRTLPRFLHVLLDDSIRRKKKAMAFVLRSQRMLKDKGYTQMFCYTRKDKTQILELARKFGFREYSEDGKGKYLYKNIGD